MRTILKMSVLVTVVVASALALGACSTSGHPRDPGEFSVAVAENFWGSIVEQLGGHDAHVTSIIANPNADPHDYEPTVADARTIATARYVVENGIGYDGWVQKLVDANPDSNRMVLNVGDLLGLDAGSNPHQWYSPRSVRRFVAQVSADLARLDPAHRATYAARRRAFESAGLEEYNRLISEIKSRYAGTPIGASESIVGPWASGLGLRLITPERFVDAIAEGNDPTRADKATVDEQIADRKIKVFVYNSQNTTPDVKRLVDAARRAGIPVTGITETLEPEHTTFQAWQASELRALLDALSGSSSP
ncbi:MAG TPA: zinc ABC transporter substrate-binding protein [Acidimicrobiia bacterium]|jgi:zinc/manganese transport system substrate-binding protein|nr:zinc ABC transporter substrate-binding protein [Acidimicrobiia bacterium]